MTEEERESRMKDEAQAILRRGGQGWPEPGKTYRHYTGRLCDVVALAAHESEHVILVIYRYREKGAVEARPLANWLREEAGKPRFVLEA